MADQKITQLPEDTAPSKDDLVVTVKDPAGSPQNKKVTIDNLLKTEVNKISPGVIEFTNQSSTPATPPVGKSVVYVKSDGYLYYMNSDGVERSLYPKGYINGCYLKYNSDSDIIITPGVLDIDGKMCVISSNLTVTWSDLDTGSEAANTFYYVYLVKPTTGITPTAKISATAPTYSNGGYYHPSQPAWRFVGSFYNDSSSNIAPFYIFGVNNDLEVRKHLGGNSFIVLVNWSNDSSFQVVDMSPYVPLTAYAVEISVKVWDTRGEGEAVGGVAAKTYIRPYNEPREIFSTKESAANTQVAIPQHKVKMGLVDRKFEYRIAEAAYDQVWIAFYGVYFEKR